MADFETIRDANNDLVRAHLHFAILFDNMDNDCPSTLEDTVTGDLEIPETAESAGVIEKKAGVSITHNIDSTDVEGYGDSDPVRTIISKRVVSFDAEFLETNKVVMEKYWGTIFDADHGNLTVSSHGGVTLTAPGLPKNIFYRAYLVAEDEVNGDELYPYYIMPKVQLDKVDNTDSKDNNAVSYKMTFKAFRDKTKGFAVLQGWCGPGWVRLVDQTGFVKPVASLAASPASHTLSVATDSAGEQLAVTGDNGINYTPLASFTSSDPAVATVSRHGLVVPVSAGSATVTAHYGGKTTTASVTVTT